jgi:CO dehydrogenase nickel-insertion accessory protein CooC1
MDNETIAKIRELAEAYMFEHNDINNFLMGFGGKKPCDCPMCAKAREILQELPGASAVEARDNIR